MEWDKPAPIVGRRTKECELFFDGMWSNNGTMTEYTRVKASGTPDRSSAKRIDVTKELRAAFAKPVPVVRIQVLPVPEPTAGYRAL
jgi:hypothetical protein